MSTNKDVLEPVAGLSREIGLMVAGLEEVRAQTIANIADLSEEELAARFVSGAHQIGGLVLHLAECEFWWMHCAFAGKEITEDDRRLAHLHDTTETDFALKGYDAERCIDRLNIIHQRTIETLSGVSDEELDRVITFKEHPLSSRGSLRWILLRLIDHEANHKGQIAMMKRLLRENSAESAAGATR
jgi:uncharacterized damage-inducible protein DinB